MVAFRFALPRDRRRITDIVVALINAVPTNWSWLDGHLTVSKQLAKRGKVARGGFSIRRSRGVTIVGPIPTIYPDYHGFVADRAFPGFVAFEEAGYESAHPTLAECGQIACSYIKFGYQGGLSFFSGCFDNKKYDNPAKMHIDLVQSPGSVGMQYDTEYGGSLELIEPLLDVCFSFNLSSEPIPRSDLVG